MGKSAFFLFIAFMSCEISSQINLKDTILYYPDGVISSKGYFFEGKPHGRWENFYEDGRIKSEGFFNYGALNGTWKFYDTTGKLISEIDYVNGRKNGFKKYWKNNLYVVEKYRDDVLFDMYCEYYSNGRLFKCIPVRNGKYDGEVLVYDTLSNPITVEKYKNGVLIYLEEINRYDRQNLPHGKWKSFYSNGQMKYEKDFYHGKLHGYVKYYDSTGKLLKLEKYIHDSLVLDAKETKEYEILRDYYPNGRIKTEAIYRDGIPDGIRIEYDSLGNIQKTYYFSNGELVFEGRIDTYGKRQGQFLEFYQGKIVSRGYYKNDLKHGMWVFYDDEGNVFQKGEFSNDKPTGKWVTYYPDGKVMRIENYEEGELNGDYVEFSVDSTILVKGIYEEGQPHGKWIFRIGDVYQEYNYNHGELIGKQLVYDKYHNLPISIENYRSGVKDGKQFYFGEDGKKKLDAQFRDGKPHGSWIYYDADGKPFLRIIYQDGEEIYIDKIKLP